MNKPPFNPSSTYLHRYDMYCLSNNLESLKKDDGSYFYSIMKKRVYKSISVICETKKKLIKLWN